jgi:hypothetical protein
MLPSEVAYAYGVFQYRVQPSEIWTSTGNHRRHYQKGEENYLHTVRSNKAEPEQLILSKTYVTKVAINNRLLDMQDYKGFIQLSESSK